MERQTCLATTLLCKVVQMLAAQHSSSLHTGSNHVPQHNLSSTLSTHY